VSLILEALKKLEREKQAGTRGFVVLSHLPWTGARSGRTALMAAVVAVVAIAAGGTAVWRWRSAAPAVSATPPGPSPTAAPSLPDPGPAMPSAMVVPPEQVDTRPVAAPPPASPVSLLAPPKAEAGGPDQPAGTAPELRLNAISVRDGHPVAIVNDRLVREGDSFDGIRILKIGDAEVEVEVAGQRRTLRF